MNDLKKIEKKLKKKPTPVASENRYEALRRLASDHKAYTRKKIALLNTSTDRTFKKMNEETGKEEKIVVPCRLQPPEIAQYGALADALDGRLDELEKAMTVQLKGLPIWDVFLSKIYCMGPKIAGPMLGTIDITKSRTPSSLRQFCGMAVHDGRADRPRRGEKLGYCAQMRTLLYIWTATLQKCAAERGEVSKKGKPMKPRPASSSKYLEIIRDVKHRELSAGGDRAKPSKAQRKAERKATDVFLEDLYIVWRALEGLPVWPSYYAAKLGYEHGGKISVNEPRMLTVDEALALVGDVGKREVEAAAAE